MTRLHLVRHGRATAGWDVDPDPGLDDVGVGQAAAVVDALRALGPMPIVTSPLRRCRETAAAMAVVWGTEARVEPAVAEIPSPDGIPMGQRVAWLRAAMGGTWSQLGERYTRFRDGVVDWLLAQPVDTVVCSHFVAINAAIGAATGDDRLVIRSLDNCSVTVLDAIGGRLHLVEAGRRPTR